MTLDSKDKAKCKHTKAQNLTMRVMINVYLKAAGANLAALRSKININLARIEIMWLEMFDNEHLPK